MMLDVGLYEKFGVLDYGVGLYLSFIIVVG